MAVKFRAAANWELIEFSFVVFTHGLASYNAVANVGDKNE